MMTFDDFLRNMTKYPLSKKAYEHTRGAPGKKDLPTVF